MKKKDDLNQEIDPYKLDKLSRVPSWIIIFIIKYWAAAAAVFFTVIGGVDIGLDFTGGDMNDYAVVLSQSFVIIVILALFLALFSNYIVRPIVRLMYNRRNNTFRYNMINFKGLKSFLLSLVYMTFVSIILYLVTVFLSLHNLVFDPFGTTHGQGIEPFTYGLCFIIVDSMFLIIKNVILNIKSRIKYRRQILAD